MQNEYLPLNQMTAPGRTQSLHLAPFPKWATFGERVAHASMRAFLRTPMIRTIERINVPLGLPSTTKHQYHVQRTQEQYRSNGNSRNRNRNRNRNRSNGGRNDQNTNTSKQRPPSQHQKFVSNAPAKLTFWQKLLKMIGLYKEPVKPVRADQRTSSQPRTENRQGDRQPKQGARSNTRDARNGGEFKKSEPRPPRERREPSLADVESTRLYIGNLSYDATESDIEELFKGVGPVRNVEIVYNKHTHKSKGYGFVEMLRIDEAKRSVEVLHDQHFMGRQLIVSGAKAKSAEDPEERAEERERKENQVAEAAAAPAVTEVVHSLETEDQKETFA